MATGIVERGVERIEPSAQVLGLFPDRETGIYFGGNGRLEDGDLSSEPLGFPKLEVAISARIGGACGEYRPEPTREEPPGLPTHGSLRRDRSGIGGSWV